VRESARHSRSARVRTEARACRVRGCAQAACQAAAWQAARATLALCLGLGCALVSAFDLQGHRGARGLAPENTIAGFELALELGVDTLELDVGVTRDDVAVVFHDRRLNADLVRDGSGRWLDGPGPPIRALELHALREFDVGRLRPGSAYAAAHPAQRPLDGARIPTLAEVLALAKRPGGERIRFNVETKLSPLAPHEAADPETFARVVVETVRAAGVADRTTVQSFDWRTLRTVRRLAPEIALAYLSSARPGFDTVGATDPSGVSAWTDGLRFADHGSVPRLVRAAGGTLWSPNARDLDTAALAEARSLGLAVVPWTVNDAALMRRLVEWGVDGLITDRPDLLHEVLVERGLRRPRAAR
jgi:glycerophosphoryl diester phosphodiesterase